MMRHQRTWTTFFYVLCTSWSHAFQVCRRSTFPFSAPSGSRVASTNHDKKESLLPQHATVSGQEPEEEKTIDWKDISKQFKLFREMALPYYQESIDGRWLLAGLLALTLLNSGVSVAFSYLSKDFWNALSEKNQAEFWFVLQKFVAALMVGAPIVALYRFQRKQLAVHWREWMTARTLQLYTLNCVYYKLPESIDNPDQRVTEDVQSFTSFSLQLAITVMTSVIDLVSFSAILWSIYPSLFGAVILYATFGTVITTLLGKKLVGLNYRQLQREADLRYSLVRLRENAESIAFYAGEDIEGQALELRLEKVMDNRRQINVAQRTLEFFTTSYSYLVQILPIAVVAPRYFAGQIQLGVISQSVGAFNHILSDLSIIVDQFESLSSFSAGIERLSGFFEAMREVDVDRANVSPLLPQLISATKTTTTTELKELSSSSKEAAPPRGSQIALHKYNDTSISDLILSIKDLELSTPDFKRVLMRNVNLALRQGEHLLIVGSSGAGKSSLLRGIAGLWTSGSGTIVRPSDEQVYFLPQRPYCTLGTLKDQLLYPMLDYQKEQENGSEGNKIVPRAHWLKQSLTDADLLNILEQVDLLQIATRAGDGNAVDGLYATLDWSNMLSLGEQQRLAFGRLLVNQPRLVILDEATSALDLVAEARMYTLLQNAARKTLDSTASGSGLSAPGLTYVSVGHRPSLLAFHDKRLRLLGEEQGYELSDIENKQNPVKLSEFTTNL